MSTISFFTLFLVNPAGMFINRCLHAWEAVGVARSYLIRYVGYLLLVTFIAVLALLLLYTNGMVDFGLPIVWLMLLVAGSLIFNTINQTAIPSLNRVPYSLGYNPKHTSLEGVVNELELILS